jgi:hypothetical protein
LDVDLLPGPAAVFCWGPDGKLQRRKRSPDTWEFRNTTESVPQDSITAQAIRQGVASWHQGKSDCFTWFPEFLYPDEPDNVALTEEVMALGRFGWLTVVYRAENT